LSYPLPSATWVKDHTVSSDLEIAIARKLHFISIDETGEPIGTTSPAEILFTTVDENCAVVEWQKKYFVLLIINLFENWFLIEKPRKALEYLVIDFFELDLAGGYDGMLRSRIAGIAEGDQPTLLDIHDWKIKVRIHRWLGDYVLEYLKEDSLRRALR
jgi:hypothetical protein